MEELFENVFVLVPVALLIFLRVFSEGARKRAEKAKKTAGAGTTAKPASAELYELSRQAKPKPAAGQRAKHSAGKTRPARHDLLGRLRNYLSGSLDEPSERLEPLHFEEEAARRLGQFRTPTAGLPDREQGMQPGYIEGLPGAMEESAAITREPAARYSFPKRLASLPPLKRAIVLSEVLGKPKSLQ